MRFNWRNRTIYGKPPSTGVWRFDFIFEDEGGLKAYANAKLTVKAQGSFFSSKYIKLFIIVGSALMGWCVYWAYCFHFMIGMVREDRLDRETVLRKKAKVRNRFDGY